MPIEALLVFCVFGGLCFGLTLAWACVDKSVGGKIVATAGLSLVLLVVVWISCSTDQRIIDKGTYPIQELRRNDGSVIQCIASDGGTAIIDLYWVLRPLPAKNFRVKVTAFDPWKNSIYWMNTNRRFYELVPPKEKGNNHAQTEQ